MQGFMSPGGSSVASNQTNNHPNGYSFRVTLTAQSAPIAINAREDESPYKAIDRLQKKPINWNNFLLKDMDSAAALVAWDSGREVSGHHLMKITASGGPPGMQVADALSAASSSSAPKKKKKATEKMESDEEDAQETKKPAGTTPAAAAPAAAAAAAAAPFISNAGGGSIVISNAAVGANAINTMFSTPAEDKVYAELPAQPIANASVAHAAYRKAMNGVIQQLQKMKVTSALPLEDDEIEDNEAILGDRPTTSVPLRLLTQLEYASFGVGMVTPEDDVEDSNPGIGTGFMISPDLFMTNHHVLKTAAEASEHVLLFNYVSKKSIRSIQQVSLQPERFFFTRAELDFTIVAVNVDEYHAAVKSTRRVIHPLLSTKEKLLSQPRLFILGHPDGRFMEASLAGRAGAIRDNTFLEYTNDTEPGSSGSPVFNSFWTVIALHHRSVPFLVNGQQVCKDGTPWTKDMPKSKKRCDANRGVLVHAIVQNLLDHFQKYSHKFAEGKEKFLLLYRLLIQDPESTVEKIAKKAKKKMEEAAEKAAAEKVAVKAADDDDPIEDVDSEPEAPKKSAAKKIKKQKKSMQESSSESEGEGSEYEDPPKKNKAKKAKSAPKPQPKAKAEK